MRPAHTGCDGEACGTCPRTERDMDWLGHAIVSKTCDADGRVVSCERVDPLRATFVDGLIVVKTNAADRDFAAFRDRPMPDVPTATLPEHLVIPGPGDYNRRAAKAAIREFRRALAKYRRDGWPQD